MPSTAFRPALGCRVSWGVNSRFKIQNSRLRGLGRDSWTLILIRAAAYKVPARADASSGPSPGETATRRCLTASNLLWGKPAAERMGLLSSSARMQPSARGRLRAAAPYGRKFRIQNSKFRITRDAACEAPAQADFRTRAAGLRGVKLRPARS